MIKIWRRMTLISSFRSGCLKVFCEKTVLKDLAKFTGKRVYRSLYFNKVEGGGLQFYQKKTPAQVLSCEFCKIFRNTYFEEHLQMPVSRACLP